MIIDKQTDKVYFSEYMKDNKYVKDFDEIQNVLDLFNVDYDFLPKTKDIWARDYMPIQISQNVFVEYQYKPDYLQNKKDIKFQTNPTEVCKALNIQTRKTNLIIDGGNIIKSKDCVILTDKALIENKELYTTEELFVTELKKVFKVKNVIIIPWDRHEKFGHADGMIRFINEKTVLMNGYLKEDKPMQVIFDRLRENNIEWKFLEYNVKEKSTKNWAYINFLQLKDLILVPKLGIEEDEQALEQIREYFAESYQSDKIRPVSVKTIIKGGGALNCISWNIENSELTLDDSFCLDSYPQESFNSDDIIAKAILNLICRLDTNALGAYGANNFKTINQNKELKVFGGVSFKVRAQNEKIGFVKILFMNDNTYSIYFYKSADSKKELKKTSKLTKDTLIRALDYMEMTS